MDDATRPRNIKVAPAERDAIRARYEERKASGTAYGFYSEVAREVGVSVDTIRAICNREAKTDRGEPLNYPVAFVPETSEDYEIPVRQPKILVWDIETSPNLAYVWGHYEQNVLRHVAEWQIMCFSAKWLDGEPVTKALCDYEGYQPGRRDDEALCRELWSLIDEADVTVAHNGDSFDVKKANARFLAHGLTPPAPVKTIDTKKVAKRYFRFNSNKLDDLGATLGLGRKLQHTGFDLWERCMAGEPEAWEMMKAYNEQDVLLLERVYLRLKPWMVSHPNMAILSRIDGGCPHCASRDLDRDGYSVTPTGRKPRYRCRSCNAWSHGRHSKVTDIR